MKRKRSEADENMEIVWQTPANPPQRQDYIFRDGIRYVRPYYFEFISHVKNRWAGKTIVDLFTDEFEGRPHDYYVSAVKAGRIQVDGQIVPVSYVVQSSKKISHFLHRHESPVMAKEIQILHIEPDVLTVCKPASVPVHPCGQYRKNTVVGILQAEHDLAPLFPFHRLDRLVSGLLIIARTASKADTLRQQIESGEVKKLYIARVIGVFPESEQVANANVNYNAREGKSTVEFMGHPITNDMLYLSECVPNRSIEGLNADRAAANEKLSIKSDHSEMHMPHSAIKPVEDFSIDPMCTNFPNLQPKGYDGREEGLWLHCVRYSGPGWTYEFPYPDWASLC